jgi:hypothetical protein
MQMQKLNRLSFLNSTGSGTSRMLTRVWQTVHNGTFGVRQIIVHVYFHMYNRIRDEGGFAILLACFIVAAN